MTRTLRATRALWPLSLLIVLALAGACASDKAASGGDSGGVQLDAGTPDQQHADGGATAPDGASADQAIGASCPVGVGFVDDTRKITFSATVDGKGPFTLIYDTGAAQTTLSPEITGAGAGGSSLINTIDLGAGVVLGPVNALTYPMPPSTPFDGIIGNDAFAGRVVSVDYGRKRLWVTDTLDEAALAACEHLAPAAPTTVPFSVDPQSGLLRVAGELDGVKGELLVDTGASLGGVPEWVLAASTVEQPAIHGYWLSAFVGTFWSSYAMISKMSVGPHSVERLVMYTLPDSALPGGAPGKLLGTLPYGFLRHFLVSVDFGKQVLRLAPIAGHKLEGGFALYGYGMSLSVDEQGPVTITDVVPGSPAAKAGLQVGDVVTDVAGVDPATVPPKNRLPLVLTQYPTEARSFTGKRDDQTKTYDLVSADVFASVP